MNPKNETRVKSIVLIALALLSIALSGVLSNPSLFTGLFNYIDDKCGNVLTLGGIIAALSTALTAVPDDIATPIATQLAEYTDLLLIIYSVLLTEKYLVTILLRITLLTVLPFSLFTGIPILQKRIPRIHELSVRIAAIFIALFLVVPASVTLSGMIEKTFDLSFETTVAPLEELNSSTEEANEAEESKFSLSKVWNKISDSFISTVDSVTGVPEKASQWINRIIQTIAIMIVTSCVIPLLVLFLALYLTKLIVGIEIRPPRPRHGRHPEHRELEEKPLLTE